MTLTLIGISCLLALTLVLSTIDVAFHYFSRIAIRNHAEEDWKTDILRHSLEDPSSLLVPLRIGIQCALIAVTVLVTQLYLSLEVPRALLVTFVTMLLAYAVFREVLPGIVARKNPERVLLALLPAYRIYSRVIWPFSRPLSRFVRAFVGEENVEEEEEGHSEEEVQAFIETGEEEGILEGDEGRMVQSIVDLGDKVVREIVTPRPEMVAIRRDATLAELRQLFIDQKYSRVPVFEENLDQVVGLIYALDLLAYADRDPEESIEPLIRPVQFVPETKKVADLLREFQHTRSTFAIVVDEYGGTSGLLTVEDILEEIVGEIHDEFDEDTAEQVVRESDNTFLVSGRAGTDVLKQKLGLDVDGKGYDTVSGLVLEALGRVPQVGESIAYRGMTIEVVDAEGHRINKVRFRLRKQDTA
jgi:CBS domain containing-hemolysin-like protein